MSNRLLALAGEIENGLGFADIGTDHAYLPIYMAQNGYKGNIIASDISEDPLGRAVNNATAAGLKDCMEFILCDGISPEIRDKIDTVVIAGMGGNAVCGILDRAEWCFDSRYKLILQPMTKAEILRYWLSYNDFEIYNELLTEDGGNVYQIICARYGKRITLSDGELFSGRFGPASRNALFEKHLSDNIYRIKKLLAGISSSELDRLQGKRKLYEGVYSELCAMRDSIKGG